MPQSAVGSALTERCRRCVPGDQESPDDVLAWLEAEVARDGGTTGDVGRALWEQIGVAAAGDDLRHYYLAVNLYESWARTTTDRPEDLPARAFDEENYLLMHPDIAAAVESTGLVSGFEHFRHHGWLEGRPPFRWNSDPAPVPSMGAPVAAEDEIHVNVIGYHTANLGLGVSCRAYFDLLERAGMNVHPVDVPIRKRSGDRIAYADRLHGIDDAVPRTADLYVVAAPQLHQLAARRTPAQRSHLSAAIVFWELPKLPAHWRAILNELDVIFAPSNFIKYGLLQDLDGPVIRDLPHPLQLPPTEPDRARWNMPDDVVVFGCSFEMESDIARKNPFAALEAFESAFPNDASARLIVKVNNSRIDDRFTQHIEELQGYVGRNANIRLLDESLSYPDVLSFYASCDVLVSLHRAEGLGLVPMEAMTLGRPVIATGWSGNMEFCTERNCCLVGYDLIDVENTTQVDYSAKAIHPGSQWADASVEDAARWMRRLADDPELRAAIGQKAAADMRDYQARIDPLEVEVSLRNLLARSR